MKLYEKVLIGLKCLGGDGHQPRCSDCPYHGKGLKPCRIAICEDAAFLLQRMQDHEENLREDFADYVTSGIPNPAPFCENMTLACTDTRGWCVPLLCEGFKPKARDNDEC